ncbi:hypothetical protein [Erwinia sp. 198]|uniref:hypothetical protein n=1 Tax=Erwinia sp. 198 TaxID=2022746 RepID=UPI000F6700A7|nr:hypothetical protein [Erwinia sp. 198]RRZ93539.1 hypothetical protein EGK14_06995 [Erwinia sp. 198]
MGVFIILDGPGGMSSAAAIFFCRYALAKGVAGEVLTERDAKTKIISIKIIQLTLNYFFLVIKACAAALVMSKCTVGFETDNVCEQF